MFPVYKGELVYEYIGEIITEDETLKRNTVLKKDSALYVFSLT